MWLEENERIDDLEYKGLKIIQNKNEFCFGMDSILLSDFAKNIKKDSKVIDLGTGTGIISILLTAKIALAHLNEFPNYYNKNYGLPMFENFLKEKMNEK